MDQIVLIMFLLLISKINIFKVSDFIQCLPIYKYKVYFKKLNSLKFNLLHTCLHVNYIWFLIIEEYLRTLHCTIGKFDHKIHFF